MSNELEVLKVRRSAVNETLRNWNPEWIRNDWVLVQSVIGRWWQAYKRWEATDTFDAAFQDKRMTVRTFGPDFDYQKSKTFGRGTIDLPSNRVFADSQYTRLPTPQQAQQRTNFLATAEHQKYHAQRGIDSSAFANPANFASRETKYEAGLHDLSASLLNPKLSIFDQIHNNDDGAHFSFLPLSHEEDQQLLYMLTQCAKQARGTLPQFYETVRRYRAEMTRVKLAQEFDMGIGYSVVPAPRPGTGPQFKLRYGLGSSMTIPGRVLPVPVTQQRYNARKQAALNFKSILGIRDQKNEILIAIRKHAGPFPIYAVRRGDRLECYDIVGGRTQLNGNNISFNGHLTRGYMRERGTSGLPVREPAAKLAYNKLPVAPVDQTLRNRLEKALENLGDIPKRSGLRVFVIGPSYDETFRGALAEVENHVHELIKKGYRLSVASLANRAELPKPEVRLYFL